MKIKISTVAGNVDLNGYSCSSWEEVEDTMRGFGAGVYIGQQMMKGLKPEPGQNGLLNSWVDEDTGAKYYNFGQHVFKAREIKN